MRNNLQASDINAPVTRLILLVSPLFLFIDISAALCRHIIGKDELYRGSIMKRLFNITQLMLIGIGLSIFTTNITAETAKSVFIKAVSEGQTILNNKSKPLSSIDLRLPIPLRTDHLLFTIQGSNTIGAKLTPNLAQAFLKTLGANDIRTVNTATNEKSVVGKYQRADQQTLLKINIAAHGSSTGFKGLLNKKADIAAASRRIKPKEKVLLNSRYKSFDGPKEIVLGIDGLAIIIHPNNSLNSLTLTQLENIYTGKITTWKTLNGSSKLIHVKSRDAKSGTYDTFRHLVLRKKNLISNAVRFESNSSLSESVSRDIDAIGFVPLASINDAKALSISDTTTTSNEAFPGVLPSELTVATEDYPLSRRLYFYRSATPKYPAIVDAFLAYAESNTGQDQVKHSGFVSQQIYALPSNLEENNAWWRLNLNIRFQKDTSNLDTKANADVQRLVAFINNEDHRFSQIRFVGYSNPTNSNRDHSPLSKLRAQNVRWALRNIGVKNQIKTVAGRATFVADPNSIRKEKNRRVEVWIQ